MQESYIKLCDTSSDSERRDFVALSNDSPSFEFRQLDYLWLFDPYLDFRTRPDFKLDEASLTLHDYEAMRKLNRTLLSIFLAAWQQTDELHEAALVFDQVNSVTPAEIEERWADEVIDEELKPVLRKKEFGAYLEVDLVAQMAYFYNTLDCHFVTDNPFTDTNKFPALTFEPPSGEKSLPLLQKYKQVIFPSLAEAGSKHGSTQDGSFQ